MRFRGRPALAEIRDAATPNLFARLRQDPMSGSGVKAAAYLRHAHRWPACSASSPFAITAF